jgi:hypothetical protein
MKPLERDYIYASTAGTGDAFGIGLSQPKLNAPDEEALLGQIEDAIELLEDA